MRRIFEIFRFELRKYNDIVETETQTSNWIFNIVDRIVPKPFRTAYVVDEVVDEDFLFILPYLEAKSRYKSASIAVRDFESTALNTSLNIQVILILVIITMWAEDPNPYIRLTIPFIYVWDKYILRMQ